MPFRPDRLRFSRERKGLTQKELSDLCGVTSFQLSRYENGIHEPAASSLESMAVHLEVSADYLLGLSDNPLSIMTIGDLSSKEQHLIDELRKNGWKGVLRFGVEQLPE